MNNSKHILRNKSGFPKSGHILCSWCKMLQSDLLVAHYADAGMMGTSNDTRVTFQKKFWKNLRKCRDELVKKYGNKVEMGCVQEWPDLTSTSHTHIHISTCGIFWYWTLLNQSEYFNNTKTLLGNFSKHHMYGYLWVCLKRLCVTFVTIAACQHLC